MDNSYTVDYEALFAAIAEHDHLLFRFQTIAPRLFVDLRSSTTAGPTVLVLPPAASFSERMETIKAARGDLPPPRRLNVVPWPMRVRSLERLDVLSRIRDRLAAMDAGEALQALDQAIATLEATEDEEERRAILGVGYQTIWPTPTR